MTLSIKLFALARDAAGAAEVGLELPDGATARQAVDALAARFPLLAPHAAKLAVAVNLEYVRRDHVLRPGDEVAIIPPVSGGTD